ncbi:hypothetical protein ARSQ2_01448 [Arsenophonus endosymbiont of Bemisia tabaci Q2]|nr:hypothetical protein ARSQ2_01448 [Arsenophonus endosymbiont of Bemisia tabaci Q2]
MRHRYFVHTQYGVIKIKSLSYTFNDMVQFYSSKQRKVKSDNLTE